MSAPVETSRVLHGHFHQLARKGRRTILWVALEPEEAEALEAALGPRPHRGASIPIAVALGRAAETLANLPRPQPAPELPAAAAPPAEPFDVGRSVARIARLTVRLACLTDAAAATPDLAQRALGLETRDGVAADLLREQAALTDHFRRGP